jgi:hypothetical protein
MNRDDTQRRLTEPTPSGGDRTKCERQVRSRLTAYLEGDLDADAGTLVRGHLRGCAACRRVASDEAALRDGLRALPTLDPPPSLWAGVQARLAAEEQAEAARPRWRRALARLAPAMPRFAAGGLAAAAAVTVVWWRTQRAEEAEPVAAAPNVAVIEQPRQVIKPDRDAPAPVAAKPSTNAARCRAPEAGDVTADLALDAGRMDACYAAAAEELLAQAEAARAGWSAEQRTAFDARIAELRAAAAAAGEGRPRQRAQRSLIRYLQNALVRDEIVALASGGMP